MPRRVSDGFCIIRDDKGEAIGEVKSVAQAEMVVQALWEKHGHGFYRDQPTSKKKFGGKDRLKELLNKPTPPKTPAS